MNVIDVHSRALDVARRGQMISKLTRAADHSSALAALPVAGAQFTVNNNTGSCARGAPVFRGKVERFALTLAGHAVARAVPAAETQLAAIVEKLELSVVIALSV